MLEWARTLRVYCFLVSIVVLMGKAGDALGVALVEEWPVALLVLNSNDVHCFLTGGGTRVDWWVWFLVTTTRRMAEDPLFYMLGHDHGDTGVEYIASRLPAADKITLIAKKFTYVSVLIDPGMAVCLIAGSTKMPPAHFFALNLTGTLWRLCVIYYLAAAFPEHVDYVLALIHTYQRYLLAAAIVAVSLSSWKLCRL
eukprot:TRINITY_DN377_c1_g1_i1.p1 TRINITY_DN377_c1_g1~~TRINITY_DN377_c1_g1_i1.p1  ORF type:complete len:197 (+),score=20.89 TRINITY_DN377_c1_g1_i1:65-655(+)